VTEAIQKLWDAGKDTYDIAKELGKRESWVYNTMHAQREKLLVPSVPKPKKLIRYVGYNNPGKKSAWD